MKQSSAKFRSNLIKVSAITLGWVVAAILISIYDHATAVSLLGTLSPSYSFKRMLLGNLLGALMGGLIGGTVIVFFLKDRIRRRSFQFVLIVNSLIYLAIIYLIISFVSYTLTSFEQGLPFWTPEVSVQVNEYLLKPPVLRNLGIWFLIVISTSFLHEVSDKYGQGVLWQFIRGKYYNPQEDVKIFMFLDMKSSTSIAEKIGHNQFFLLLSDFFNDITDPIINNNGQIYQYVGDEIVMTWKLETGIKNASCVKCFFDMEDAIRGSRDKYIAKYGVVPEFKAGLHFGQVTVGEVGVIKKEIVYSGDVINTTSRIQSTCNTYGEKLLISKDLLEKISLDCSYKRKELGSIQLRGKQSEVTLFSINRI
ncbi:MAG: adenylate/guanylate cyclase domain-containing protein [Desulfobulbaceae bacterium]|nr:adenylate/guanylate cyclase domain-containing protein [Desulfobulbaceae bacterium]